MKITGKIIGKDMDKKIITVQPVNMDHLQFLEVMHVVELITDPDKKDKIRRKIFSLIGFLWDRGIYDIFGDLVKDSMRRAIELRAWASGETSAYDMYRYNIYLQCGFTQETIALVPNGDKSFVRMFCEVAKSMSNESGVTYEDLVRFYEELEYITAYHCGDKLLCEWESQIDIKK